MEKTEIVNLTKLNEGEEVLTSVVKIQAGHNLSYSMHKARDKYWIVVSGVGEFVLNNGFLHVKAGDVLQIPSGSIHSMNAICDMEWIEIQTGKDLAQDDSVCLLKQWDEIVKYCRLLVVG